MIFEISIDCKIINFRRIPRVIKVIYNEFKLFENTYFYHNFIFMNFLAHAHLSGKNHEILFGNFIADAVKGKDFERFEKDIQIGIKLHRKIDSYTDSHPIFKTTLNKIRKDFGKYSGIVVDIYYDHFLAKNWNDYHNVDLKQFAKMVYSILKKRYLLLPARTKRLLPFLITQNWLVGYANLKDLNLVFYGMDRRTGLQSGMSNAVEVLEKHYDDIKFDFDEFYPELIKYSYHALTDLKDENT